MLRLCGAISARGGRAADAAYLRAGARTSESSVKLMLQSVAAQHGSELMTDDGVKLETVALDGVLQWAYITAARSTNLDHTVRQLSRTAMFCSSGISAAIVCGSATRKQAEQRI